MARDDDAREARISPQLRDAALRSNPELMRLALEIEGHNERYYQKDAPTVSDAAYDALRQRLEAIEAKFPQLVDMFSPPQKVAPSTCSIRKLV